jgi:hypothetical protein
MALELASAVACKDLTAATRDSTVVLRSSRSPMAAAQDVVDEDAGEGGAAAGGGEGVWRGEEALDRDTRLSRASNPLDAGPWLRSS